MAVEWLSFDSIIKNIQAGAVPMAVFGGLYTLWMKKYLAKTLEKYKTDNAIEIEDHKQGNSIEAEGYKHQSKNIEEFIEREYEAIVELYSIRDALLPSITDSMDGDEVMTAMTENIDYVVPLTKAFIKKYFPILPPEIIETLEVIALIDENSSHTEITAFMVHKNITQSVKQLKSNFDGRRPVKFSFSPQKSNNGI